MLDRDLVEENLSLLLPRWKLVSTGKSEALRLGMDAELTAQLRSLDEVQVHRAADAVAPLFRAGQPDDVFVRLLKSDDSSTPAPLDDVDKLIQQENHLFLLNRWNMARLSQPHCQCLYGLSTRVIEALRTATLGDLSRASCRGVRLAHLGTRPKYLFHAGRHVSMTTSMRTQLAVCATSRLRA